MSDLVQTVESGFDLGDRIDWDHHRRTIVPASNRRRILDREHRRGVTPGADGWLTIHTDHATGCTTVTRIRWEDTALYAPADLDRMEHQ